jgi:hypothetical protein
MEIDRLNGGLFQVIQSNFGAIERWQRPSKGRDKMPQIQPALSAVVIIGVKKSHNGADFSGHA